MELWLHTFAIPGRVAEVARRTEEWGFTGLLVADSQNVTADIWVELALAGAATSSLRVGPGLTSPVTRHVAVTASAAATLQAENGGRATLGFAQGDSALSQLSLSRLSVSEFERALGKLQGFLRGEQVQPDGTTSAIRWLAGLELPKVPVHVAATGRRTIRAAAKHAEGLDLTVGGELERIRWGTAIPGRQARPNSRSALT
jgi:5,10-methylenetetrahydromethanopterin reductase